MKSSVENVSTLQRKLNIEIPSEKVQTAFEKVFESLQKGAAVKGFRKGKVPMTMIRSLYGDSVKQDVAQNLIQTHYPAALSEHKLDPISYPEFEFKDPAESTAFSFSVIFDVRPEVALKSYENLVVEKEKLDFDGKKIDEVIQNILNSRSTMEDLIILRPAQNGDVAMIDFEGFVENQPLDNGRGENQPLELGAKQFIPGFEEGLLGMNVGETRTLNLQFPDPYQAAELAGKPVQFKVALKGLKRKVVPELNEEFIKTLGGPSSVEDLRKTIQEDLESGEKKRIEDAFKNRLLKRLVESNPVEVPPTLLKEQKETLITDFMQRMKQRGMADEELEAYVQKWDGDFAQTAAQIIQASFLVDAIARKHDLVCKKIDVENKLESYSREMGIELERIKEFYSKPEQMSRLTYMLTEEKVIEHLMKSIKIKEVPRSELKEEEAE